ncbi:hypothetical protein [Calothrix sp. PCC 6303]|nr:hypothetical protein [Calothrix sp. PCC 6303]
MLTDDKYSSFLNIFKAWTINAIALSDDFDEPSEELKDYTLPFARRCSTT